MSNLKQPNGTHPIEMIFETIFMIAVSLFKFCLKRWRTYQKQKHKIDYKEPIELKDLKNQEVDNWIDCIGHLVKNCRPLDFWDFNTDRHTMIVGPSGCGKTNLMAILQMRAADYEHTQVFFDPKASVESQNTFTEACAKAGKKVYYFTDHGNDRACFNPLLDGNIDQICDRIVNACSWSDNYYKSISINSLKEVLYYLDSQREIITLNKIVIELKKRPKQNDIAGLIVQLETANSSEFGKLVNDDSRSSLSFQKIREENACLYIGISSLGYFDTAKFFNSLFFDNLLFHCYESLKFDGREDTNRSTMSVFFDELSSIINPRFIELQNKCRAADINIIYATQAPSDISTVSPRLCDQIFENTENFFLFNQMVGEHTDYLSGFAGTYSTTKETYQMDGDYKTGTGSMREVDSFRLHPNVLRNLRRGQCVHINRDKDFIDILNVRKHVRPEIQKESLKPINFMEECE